MMYSLRSNAQYQLMTLGAGIVGLIYIFLQHGRKWDSVKGLVMALAYAWGLVLAIYLMGHGLVALPRTLFRYANIGGRLKRLQSHAPKIHERLTETLDKLDQYESQVGQLKQRKNGTARDYQEWIDELVDMCSFPESRSSSGTTRTTTVPPVITEKYLAELTRKLIRARHAKARFSDEWDTLVQKAIKTQTILDSKASKRLEFADSKSTPTGSAEQSLLSRFNFLTPYTRYHLHVHVIPGLIYISSFVTSLASLAIVWSECIRSPKWSLVGLTVVHHPSSSRGQIGFAGQVIAAVWLSYMCMAAFFSLTEVKIWGNRALVKRNTYQESATWYGLQVAKLTVPLAYNFITFTPHNIYSATSFHKFLGRLIVLTPLGENFSNYFPAFILVPVLASTFGLYGRVKNICGFGDLLEDEEDSQGSFAGTGSWREGRALIEREIQAANGSSLGLSQRGAVTSPPNGRYSDNPAGPSTGRTRPERRRPVLEDDEEGGGFFDGFGTRIKNTFETTDFSMPKWLSSGQQGSSAGSSRAEGSVGDTDRNSSWTRIFGGRADEGRVRL